MSRIANRTGRAASLQAMLPLLSKFSNVAARVLPELSKASMYFVAFIILTNINSFPFVWHCESLPPRSLSTRWSLIGFMRIDKVFRHLWTIRMKLLFYRLTLIGEPRKTRKKLVSDWLDRLSPIGSGANSGQLRISPTSHPFASEPWGCPMVIKKFAGPDESDWNLHLSNSSYPKVRCPSLSVLASERKFSAGH